MAGTSRMSREAHVRICGGLEVRFLRSTRLALRSCKGDGGGPSEAALQGEASNRHKLLWSKAMVVSVDGKGVQDASGVNQEGEHKLTDVSVETPL